MTSEAAAEYLPSVRCEVMDDLLAEPPRGLA